MKKITKLTLSALTIAVCFAACTKDNSVKTSQSSVKLTPGGSNSLATKKDTIQPKTTLTTNSKVSTTTTSSSTTKKDTIQPTIK